jgi:hypothetical protein
MIVKEMSVLVKRLFIKMRIGTLRYYFSDKSNKNLTVSEQRFQGGLKPG